MKFINALVAKFILSTIIFLSLVLNNFAFGQIPQSSEIIAYYPFSGNANDSSGNEYDGTISGDPQLTTDRFGNSNSAYIFDGAGDWIYFGTDTLPENNGGDVSDPFTISVWAKSSSSTTMSLFAYGGMVSCGGGRYGAVVRLGTNIQFNSCNNGFNTSASGKNSDGNWHQYVFTWNGSNSRKVYIDGSLVNSNSTSNVFRIQNTGLVLGRQFMDWAEGTTFTGSADELRLWSTELSSSEVQTLYNTESNAPPTLSSSVPADNATGIALDSTIVLNFNENVDVESGNITIKKTSDNSTVETIDVTSEQVEGSGTSQITVTPASDFDSATEYYVLIDATAFDDSGSASYAGITSTTALSFTSTNPVPTLSSSVPADNATGVAVNSTIVLNFSENVDVESGNITIKKTTDNSTIETIDVTSGQVTGSGTSQITITPSSDFDTGTEYYVLIDATAFDDSDSGSYAGISSTTALSFTSTNPVPTLSSSVPADNATGVAVNSTIVLNFSENVDVESGNITIKKTTDNSTIETIDVTSGQVTGSGTSQITITPSSDFDTGTEYYVLIDATAFDDSDSGSYAGISSTTALSFTIDSLTDPTTDKNITGTIDVQNMVAKTTITEFTDIVNDRLRYLRLNRINDDFSKNNIKFDFGNAMFSSLAGAMPVSNISVPDLIPKNWSFWSEGSVSITTIGDNNNSSSKDIDTHGLALGFDTKLNNNDLLGFALQFNHSDTDVGTSGTGIDSKNYNLSVYRTRPLNDDNFIEGLLSIGSIDSDLVRKSGANTLTGSRDGNQIFGSLNYGKTFSKKDFSLTPIGRIDLGYTELDSYTERGTDALTYDKQVVESGLASIGLAINDIIEFSNSSLKPFGLMKYGLDFSNSSDTKMNYVSDTSTIYTYTQGINSTHLLTAEVGFNYVRTDSLKLSGSYKRIQGNESEKTDTIKFGFNYKSQRAAEYAMNLDNDKASLSYKKDLNGFDIRMSSNYSLMSQIPEYGATIEVVNTF